MMTISILTIKPNQDVLLTAKTELQCRGHRILIETDPDTGTSIQIDEGSKILITQDFPMSIDGVHFTLKIENDGVVLFPQSDGLEVRGNASDPVVHRIIQSNLRACLLTINKVSELEQDERQQGASKIEGNVTSDSNRGYALLCQLYLILYAAGLDKTEKAQLQAAYTTLTSLTKLSLKSETMRQALITESLYATASKPADRSLLELYDESRTYPYSIALQTLTDSLTDKLLKNGYLYLNYGLGGGYDNDLNASPGHHEVVKISFDGNQESGIGKYRWTVYNAGYESDWINADKGLVAGVKEYELNCNDWQHIERFIKLLHERKFRSDTGISAESFKKIDTELKKYVQREIRSNQKSAQIRGNCTTMSIRLCLEEIVSPSLFKKLYSFVSNPANLQKLLATSWQEEKDAPSQTMGKVTSKISKLASKLTSSKAFSSSDKNNVIQDLINKSDISGIVSLLKAERTKPKMNYLQKSPDMRALYDLGNGKQGTLLHLSIKTNTTTLAEECLKLGMTGIEKDASGYPALHMAIIQGQNDIATLIIQQAKNRDALSVAANDGVTAIKLALECDRTDIVLKLAENGADLSPEKNDGHVIFSMIMEKALFDPDSTKYVALMNTLIQDPAKNNIDPNIVNGLGKSAIEICQGKIVAETHAGNVISPELVKLLNNLCALDANDQAKFLINNVNLMTAVFPYLDLAVFRRIFDAFVATAQKSGDSYMHYMGLIIPALQSANTEKLEYMLQQKIPGMSKIFMVYMASIMDLSPAGLCPLSRNTIELLLQKIFIAPKNAEILTVDLKKFFPAEIVAEIMKNAKIKLPKSAARLHVNKDENPAEEIVEMLPENQAQIINDLLRSQQEEIRYRQNLVDQFVQRKKSYYKFGDLTRALIKFLTGLDVTRKDARFQPQISLPKIIRDEIRSFRFGNLFSTKKEVVNKSSQSTSSNSIQKTVKK
jgi:hypothetical protein